MLTYPKIETLFVRDEATHKVNTSVIRRPEFGIISHWLITEKIDGTNVRVRVRPSVEYVKWPTEVSFLGRTDNAQMPKPLLDKLAEMFSLEAFEGMFEGAVEAILFGEGYGPKIQKGGGNYRDDPSFRLFDVVVVTEDHTWWLEWPNIEDVASKLGIKTVPMLLIPQTCLADIAHGVRSGVCSRVADEDRCERTGVIAEGVVARTEPPLFDRRGHRVVWKLKTKDF